MVMVAVHPKTFVTERADRELQSFLTELQLKHKLTDAEMMLICARQLGYITREAVRSERHPDDQTKIGDEA